MSQNGGAGSSPGPGARISEKVTNPRGLIAAAIVVVTALGAFIALGQPISGWFDNGPDVDNLAVEFQELPDGSIIRETDYYLLPYGAALPDPGGGGYCGPSAERQLREIGVLTGGFVRFTIQNNYTGEEAADIQVLDVSVVIREEAPPKSGVVVECANSGGDMPIYAAVNAVDGDRIVENGDESVGPVAFVLESGEPQLVYVAIQPQNMDVEIDLVANVVINGESSSLTLNSTPIRVPSKSNASPIIVHPKGVQDPTGSDYWCFAEGGSYPPDPNPCESNQVFDVDAEHQYLSSHGPLSILPSAPRAIPTVAPSSELTTGSSASQGYSHE